MDQAQFEKLFLPFMLARMPEVKTWLNKQDSGILESWWKALKRCDVDAAKKAIELMIAGEAEMPKNWMLFPAAIRTAIANWAPYETKSPAAREDRLRCRMCRDTGLVVIVHPKSIFDFEQGRFELIRAKLQADPECSDAVPCMLLSCSSVS